VWRKTAGRMDLVAVVQAYILRILEEAGPGMKVRLNMYIAAIPCTDSSSVEDPDRDP
jgi:hypothetical protein